MFEDRTFENIMAEMMEDMPQGLSTMEGSLLYNSCAKQAVRLEEAYRRMDAIDRNMSVLTADLEHLMALGADRGCYIEQATYAEFTAQFNVAVPDGSRFNCGDYNYTVFRCIDDAAHIYEIGCDSPGAEPNIILGDLDPIEFIENFEWGKITKCNVPGKDREETETYRIRLLNNYNYRGFAGNREYYIGRVKEMSGVLGCKLTRVQSPSDRIKITIIGKDFRTPAENVVEEVQTALDPVVNSGEGDGLAPIGHRVNVLAVGEKSINISTKITYGEGFLAEDCAASVQKAIEDYLLELRATWEASEMLVVRILQIEAAIVQINGIIDVANTTINGAASNLQITDGTVPVKGEVVCL